MFVCLRYMTKYEIIWVEVELLHRTGYGTKIFFELIRLLKTDTIDIEVFEWNKRGVKFWDHLD